MTLPTTPTLPPTQLVLETPDMTLAELQMAERLWSRSPLIRRRWPSFDAALADPLTGKALRLAARSLVRNQEAARSSREPKTPRRRQLGRGVGHGGPDGLRAAMDGWGRSQHTRRD